MGNEFLIVTWVIAIVLVINSHIVTSNQRQEAKRCIHNTDCGHAYFCITQNSDHGECREKNERVRCKGTSDCNKLGYFGHVECQHDYCTCTNSSKQIRADNAQECDKKSYGQKCLYPQDCQNDLECVHQNNYKICQCPKHRILYLNKCVDMSESKYGFFCESNDECNATGLHCHTNGRCQCNDGLINFKEQCIKVQQLGLCIDNNDCPRIEYCNKTADNALFGQCSRIKIPEMYDLQNNGMYDSKTISDEPNSARVKHILLICVLVLFIILMIILGIIIFIRGYSCKKIFSRNRRFGSYTSPDHFMLTGQNRNKDSLI